ncbi:Galactosyl transferase [Penicillium cf. griseofulvum]|nr:Galactosyl transferase [Penicillium cf. griseofulvum]
MTDKRSNDSRLRLPTSSITRALGLTGWTKVTAIKEALRIHRIADAMIHYPNLPLEWLFNYWEITPETLVAMALASEAPRNHGWNGHTLLNTGFIIAQQSPRTQELFEAWKTCPAETRYADCGRWGRDGHISNLRLGTMLDRRYSGLVMCRSKWML